MADLLTIRPYTDEDLPQVLEVLRRALGEPGLLRRTEDLWRWKHEWNPFGRSIVLLACDGERVAGIRAFMRWQLTAPDGSSLECVRAVDTATDPDYRRRGIFRSLTEAAVSEARASGIHLIFNTPNPASGAGYRSMGWSDVGPIGAMVRPRIGRAVRDINCSVDSVFPGLGPVEPQPVTDRAGLGLRTPRTTEYQTWRFTRHPAATYVQCVQDATSVILRPHTRKGRTEARIVDVLGPVDASILRRTVRHHRARYAAAWWSAGTPERRSARLAGFGTVPRLVTLTLVARPLVDLDIDVTDPGSWDLAVGDLELL